MKKQIVGMGLLVAMMTSPAALAGVAGGAGTWTGTGAVYDSQAREISPFKVQMVSRAPDANSLETTITVTLPDGQTRRFTQRLHDQDRGFSIESDFGKGGGACFGAGLCEAYIAGQGGKAQAITLVIDGPDARRLLVTQLQDGRATEFIRQSYRRQ